MQQRTAISVRSCFLPRSCELRVAEGRVFRGKFGPWGQEEEEGRPITGHRSQYGLKCLCTRSHHQLLAWPPAPLDQLPPSSCPGSPTFSPVGPRQCTGGEWVRVFLYLGPYPCPIFPSWCRWTPFHGGSAELNSVSPKFMSHQEPVTVTLPGKRVFCRWNQVGLLG